MKKIISQVELMMLDIEKKLFDKIKETPYRESSKKTGFTVGYFCNIINRRTKMKMEQVLKLAKLLL